MYYKQILHLVTIISKYSTINWCIRSQVHQSIILWTSKMQSLLVIVTTGVSGKQQ